METATESLWSKSKVLIKGVIIIVLVLFLLIPTFFVTELVTERLQRQQEAIQEVSSKWATEQIVTGPVIVLPFWKVESTQADKIIRSKQFAYFLPDELIINGKITPKEKYRGIYKVMLYTSKIDMSGSFKTIDPSRLGISLTDVIWNEAYVKLNISDVKGLNEELHIKINDSSYTLSPQTAEDNLSNNGLTAPFVVKNPGELKNLSFKASIDLNGSQQLSFIPLGKVTNVTLQSTWPHPSFSGDILPVSTEVNNSGFKATWKSLAHKRAFPQQWTGGAYKIGYVSRYSDNVSAGNHLSSSSFGADLFVPVDNYQKILRSVKYAILCILLTFAAFFLIETTNKKSVHPFQYGLVGLALVLFYTLLLSFSEYVGFNLSYAIASIATIGLITWFVRGVLSSGRLSSILAAILFLMYTYVFTILQLQDYSLLFGSIGLFITLGVIMYFSRSFKW